MTPWLSFLWLAVGVGAVAGTAMIIAERRAQVRRQRAARLARRPQCHHVRVLNGRPR